MPALGKTHPCSFAAAARAGAKGELLRLLPRLITSANTARSLALGLQPYAMGEEMSAKLLQVDQKLQASHNVLSQMVRKEQFGDMDRVKATVDRCLSWLGSAEPVARAMLSRLQPKQKRAKKPEEEK